MGAILYGERMLKASTMRADFIPMDKTPRRSIRLLLRTEKFPEDVNEKEIELNAAPATRRHMLDFLAAIETAAAPLPTSRRATSPPRAASWLNCLWISRPPADLRPEKQMCQAAKPTGGCAAPIANPRIAEA